MPIYEYHCEACGHELEALQKVSDPLLTDCPQCSAAALVKVVSAPSFRLKGGGWYETDFKTGNKKNLAGEAAEKGGSDKKDAGKTDKTGKPDAGKAKGGDKTKPATGGTASSGD